MLYRILKIYVRLVIRLFCHSIEVNKPETLQIKGPLLIASNHPNSFLDAVIYDILFDVPIWSLARGDVFKRFPKAVPLLTSVRIFPIYRTREGTENLTENYQTFEACMKVFEKSEAVTIFSEALCVNEWHLRPLKKGTSRIAFMAWKKELPVKVIPAGINYSSFRRYGKKIHVNFSDPILPVNFDMSAPDGIRHTAFNKILKERLHTLVYEIEKGDNEKFDKCFNIQEQLARRALLFIPSVLAVVLHAPLYLSAKMFTKKLVNNNDHYDSVILAFLVFTYPFYLFATIFIVCLITKSAWSLLILPVMPLLVLAYVKSHVRKDVSFQNAAKYF